MDVGVVLQTTPPASRVIDLAKRAESLGFSHVWTFDSHILWEEPYVIYSQILAETRNVVVGPMVTNPATRDWTVTASTYATLNEMYGNRTVCGIGRGDSAVRVTNGKPTTLATMAEATHVIRELANGRSCEYNGSTITLPWASKSELEVWGAGYGPKALKTIGETCDGFILQLADPQIAAWTIASVRAAAADAGRDPDDLTICVAAPAYVGDDIGYMRDQVRWFGGMVGNHVADMVTRVRRSERRHPPGAHRLHQGPRRGTTTTSTARPATPTPTSCPMRSSTGSASWARRRSICGGCTNSPIWGSISSRSTSSTTARTTRSSNTASGSCPSSANGDSRRREPEMR